METRPGCTTQYIAHMYCVAMGMSKREQRSPNMGGKQYEL